MFKFVPDYDKLIGSTIPFVVANRKGLIEWINKPFTKLSGYTLSELKGESIKVLMPKEYSDNHDEYFFNYIETKEHPKGMGRELPLVKKDKTVIDIIIRLAEIKPIFRGKKIAATFVQTN